jgi:hypothetical protein
MNTETIYNVLLDQPRQIDGKTWHGFSYQLSRSEEGAVTVNEIGWPTKLTIYEADGPELDALDEATVKAAVESALPVDEGYVIPPPPVPFVPTYTATEWVDQQKFDGNRPTTLLYLKLQLDAAQKTSAKLSAVQGWLDGMIVAGVTAPDEKRSDYPVAPFSFEEASGEALQTLNS